jgi:hypothetical protein
MLDVVGVQAELSAVVCKDDMMLSKDNPEPFTAATAVSVAIRGKLQNHEGGLKYVLKVLV